jgi:hypothetical protein
VRSAQDPFPALVSCARVQSTDSGLLQALPEQARLANPANLVPSRDNALFAILAHQIAQRVHQLRLRIFEPLIVRAKVDGRIDSASILLYLRFSARPARFMRRLFLSRLCFSIIIADARGIMFCDRVVYGLVLTPSLDLVPRSLSRTRQIAGAWALPENPREETLRCRAANSSARDFPLAAGRLHLPMRRRTAHAATVQACFSCRIFQEIIV